jgi:rubrerythrin
MAKRKLITLDQKKRIADLVVKGLSDSEVAGALKISSETVRKIRLDNNIVAKEVKKNEPIRRHVENNGSEKTDRERGAGAPGDPIRREESREPEHHNSDDHTAGEGKITFTGGKKHQQGGKTDMSKEGKEEFDWKCPKCGHEWNGSADECPQCKTKLQE